MPETKMWPPSRRMHYFKVLCAWGTAYSTVYLHIIASAKCNTSVGNDNYQRLETDTDSTLATGASLKLPWSLAKQSWQTSLAVKHQTAANPCVWCCLLMYEIWVTILQYEVACSCCVHVTSVDVMIIILINTTAQVFVTVQGFILCKDWCCSHCKTGTQPVSAWSTYCIWVAMAMRLLINCPFVSELKGVTFACFLVDISAHFSRDGCIHLAISWCCSSWVRMWLLGQGVSFNAQWQHAPCFD